MAKLGWRSRISRRQVVQRVGGGGLALGLAVQSPPLATAQEECQETPLSTQPPALLQDWADAWNAADPAAAVAALYSENALYEDIPRDTDTTLMDTDVAGFLAPFVAATSDLLFGLRSGYRAGDRATAEWEVSFRYTGQFPGLPTGSGQLIEYRGVTTFQLAADEIQRSTDYYDFSALLAATGTLPSPAATPTA